MPKTFEYKAGDVVGFSGNGQLSVWINLATAGIPWWSLSHAALIAPHPTTDELVLYESTTLYDGPCLVQGKKVAGVQAHDVEKRAADYDGKVWLYSLAAPLTPEEYAGLRDAATSYLGTRYDRSGAFQARQAGFGWLERLCIRRPEDLSSLFCSEFVAACLKSIGRFEVENVSIFNPNRLGRELLSREIVTKPVRLK